MIFYSVLASQLDTLSIAAGDDAPTARALKVAARIADRKDGASRRELRRIGDLFMIAALLFTLAHDPSAWIFTRAAQILGACSLAVPS
jgi:hypothetical protein